MLPPPPPPPPVPLDVSDADTERRLNSMCTRNPDRFFNNLLDIICSSAADSQRRFQAAVTLRHFFRLNSDLKSRLRDDAEAEEETRSLLEELRGAAIELGSYFLPDDSWPEFYSLMAAISPRVRESALFIFSRLAHRIKWKSILPRLDLLRSLIRCSLNIKLSGEEVPYERNVALLAAITLIHIVPPSEDCQMLQHLLPDMISVLLEAFTGNQQDFAKEAVIRLTNLITVKPKFISPCLSKVLEAMLPEFDKVNKELRREAVNLVVMLAKKEPVMVVQQLVPFLGGFVAILLEMLSDMKDDEDKDTGEENNLKYAKTFSNTLSAALGGDLLVPVLIKLLPGYLEDSDWKKRHAALFFLKEIAKGCVEVLKEHLGQIVKMMVASFKDKHPRVKWAALIAMRELLVDLKPDLEDQYHETIFPALLQAMKTFDRPHFQVEATWAAWKFMRWCSEDILKIYLNEMLDMLYTITTTQTGNRVVQDNALLILGYLATLQKERLGISYVENTPAGSVFRQLAELRTACARARVPLPPVDISRVSLIDSVRFAPQLAELAGSDIAPCLELVGLISWQRLRSDYEQLGRAHSDYAQTLASIELGLTQARQTLSFLECRFIQQVTLHSHLAAEGASLEVLEHEARLVTVCERDLACADEVVTFYSSRHQECSRAHVEAGARFTAMLMLDRSRRERIKKHLGRIAEVLEELASYS